MCHQSIEKILKAYYVHQLADETPPFSHNLRYLAEKSDLYNTIPDDYKNFINELMPLNIEARYPSYKEQLMKVLTQNKCLNIIKNTKKFQQWIKQKLSVK